MQFLGKLIEILDADMTVPKMYGWFHLLFFSLSIIAGILLCRINKNGDPKFVRRLLLAVSLGAILLEIYKQFNYTFTFDGVTIKADYQWYAFPYQFCSTPMIIGLLASLIKNERIHGALCAYLATFSVFAGLCVMLYPAQVFIDTIGINIQTMLCHGSMLTVGIYLLYTEYVKSEHKTILKAIPVFAVCVGLAAIMNEIAHATGLLETETFNMFFISPYCEPSLPVYSIVQHHVPYPWCTLIYIVSFSLAAYIILLTSMLLKKVFQKNNKKIKKSKKLSV